MFLWQRQASARWLAANEFALENFAGTDLAVIALPGKARTIFQVTCQQKKRADELLRKFGGTIKPLSRNWMPRVNSHRPIRIGQKLEIVSEPSSTSKRPQLVIPAAGAFGTGEHATTAMSLRLLEERARKFRDDWRLFDAGTGTGILALAARKFGATEVLGLDNDPRAIANARYNARLNRIGRARFMNDDILQFKTDRRYNVVTANLFSELLISALPIFRRAMRNDGHLILSGILRQQSAGVIKALGRWNFQVEKKRRRGKWVALSCTRSR